MMLPDKLVLVFSPNEQSLRGVLEAGWQAVQERKAAGGPRPLPLFPLLSRVENSEETLKRHWVKRARGAFERMFQDAYGGEARDLDTYFNLVRIPHQSFYAYGEKIAAEEQAAIEIGSLAQAYQQLSECLECASAEDAQRMLEGRGEEPEWDQELLRMLSLRDEDGLRKKIQQAPDEPVAQLFYAMFLSSEQTRRHEAVAAYDQIVRRFSGRISLEMQGAVRMPFSARHLSWESLNATKKSLQPMRR